MTETSDNPPGDGYSSRALVVYGLRFQRVSCMPEFKMQAEIMRGEIVKPTNTPPAYTGKAAADSSQV